MKLKNIQEGMVVLLKESVEAGYSLFDKFDVTFEIKTDTLFTVDKIMREGILIRVLDTDITGLVNPSQITKATPKKIIKLLNNTLLEEADG